MRKQDRIANDAQSGRQQPERSPQAEKEQVKGSLSREEREERPSTSKTQRQPGRLPLPD